MTDLPAADHTHLVNNGKRALTLDELARQQPGMDRLMAEIGPRVHRLCFAARANVLHAQFGKPFLVWTTPTLPPDDLDLRAGMTDPPA